MARPKNSYAEMVSQAQVMATGLRANQAELSRRGVGEDFVVELDEMRNRAIRLNDEQERLKAQLKSTTEELQSTQKMLSSKLSEAKKLVKITIPQTGWRAFGIEAKR